jgi:hypothetical protein
MTIPLGSQSQSLGESSFTFLIKASIRGIAPRLLAALDLLAINNCGSAGRCQKPVLHNLAAVQRTTICLANRRIYLKFSMNLCAQSALIEVTRFPNACVIF